ncbi:alpha/beta fold hydrolase [Agromyces sp. NPDC057865]|uniref:alpha/beta hydrolase n=1 Tax=Agromyces sp. NPDC057865 TaxID=3346267 RepID=UPI00366DC52E
MGGTVVYLHGTGLQDHEANKVAVAGMLQQNPTLRDFTLVYVPWDEYCPPPADLDLVLPVDARRPDPDDPRHPVEAFVDDFAREAGANRPDFDVAMRLLTDIITRYRSGLSRVLADFLQYVVYYFRVDDETTVVDDIRRLVAQQIAGADQSQPVVVVGHSLGGIMAIDVASGDHDGRIDLVVTVGSQSPLLYVLGASPQFQGPDRRDPIAPWLNLYNPRDPLSFLAAEAFAWAKTPPVDVPVDDPRDLIASHTGYSTNPAVYEQIAARLTAS